MTKRVRLEPSALRPVCCRLSRGLPRRRPPPPAPPCRTEGIGATPAGLQKCTLAPLPLHLPPARSKPAASSPAAGHATPGLPGRAAAGAGPVTVESCVGDMGCWWCKSPWQHPADGTDLNACARTTPAAVPDAHHLHPHLHHHRRDGDGDPDPERRLTPYGRVHPDSFTGAIRHALVIGYFFSMIYPEVGPSSLQESARARRWTPLRLARALYAGLTVVGLCIHAGLSLYREMTSESLWDSSVDMMFFGSATAATLLFLDLGPRWRRLTQAFECVESRMSDFGYPQHLRRRMKRLTAVVLVGAAVEHILSVWSAVDYTWPCYDEAGAGGLLKGYSLLKFPMTFSVTAYEHWKAVVVLIFNFVATFFWNFNHLFVMLISMPLSQRFKQINDRLEAVTGKVMTDDFWRRARETYNELSVLSRQVDDAVGKLVLLSFASNMYFICRQLLHSFRTPRTGFWYNLYFSYSFGYMLLRTVLVSLFAASVNDQSRRPLPVLFGVPAEGFSHEVERFMSQVTRDHVALTGCRFFSVTRGLILTVAGTIISYEIVLMQLHPMGAGTPHKTDHMDHCGM
ncbi:hypothetical protein ONE63_006780 [Megalurothrips usitatus]|uniref:Gustatory receptor n=1 Tax=Megalurothrips usitatus TaxID=439358 RepID=A0AAV7XPY8_9NEOP|nr:hypothetical protein ONE63_006780 [Megalurothrips usitatus]